MTKRTLFVLAIGSLVVFTVLGWGIMAHFGPVTLTNSLQGGAPLPMQAGLGLMVGSVVGFLAWNMVNLPFFRKTRDFFVDIIGPLKLNWTEVVMVSCCAGIGEEILFRGAVQPHLGIVWTSILFVALHGYLNPFDSRMTTYGLFMILAICLLGWVAVKYGLITAIVAHTVIDVILLYLLTRTYLTKTEDVPLE